MGGERAAGGRPGQCYIWGLLVAKERAGVLGVVGGYEFGGRGGGFCGGVLG